MTDTTLAPVGDTAERKLPPAVAEELHQIREGFAAFEREIVARERAKHDATVQTFKDANDHLRTQLEIQRQRCAEMDAALRDAARRLVEAEAPAMRMAAE